MDFPENPVRFTGSRGSIEVITGSMFSGKTEELLRRLRRVHIDGLKVEIFKPAAWPTIRSENQERNRLYLLGEGRL